MTVTSSGIVNGVIEDKYGKRGTQFTENGMPNYSLPLKIENAPEGTKTFAIFLEDKDAIPVAGFSWIHWVVANIETNDIPENASLLQKNEFVQGRNSWSSSLLGSDALSVEESSMYGGMAPPNAEHRYEIHVYALSDELDLENGFYANELFEKMRGKVLDSTTIAGTYKN
ncbi:phosphatidylethanolamine-binding protein [Candidatus Arthromitus sp. SFB-turkey]|nr:YbhB/YbcL family Raf kinase inhibitor-like protein [Candidatus Arthromitus sp. SFB-turkey]OAT89118.1 phosphatidylethanolamine-binding protein [Candidatus Arthromitus sp. SFB-turkey]